MWRQINWHGCFILQAIEWWFKPGCLKLRDHDLNACIKKTENITEATPSELAFDQKTGVNLSSGNEHHKVMQERVTRRVLDAPIDVVDWDQALGRILAWASRRESRYVLLCNVYSVVTARRDAEFGRVVAEADMATADGAPVAWLLRKQGFLEQQRLSGTELMLNYCVLAEQKGLPVYFYGSTPATLCLLEANLRASFPKLVIAGSFSPPFRSLNAEEERAEAQCINASGTAVVFVGLGCPKQELWMNRQRGQINAVMIGVGAAFDFVAGTAKRAPLWMQHIGLEWLHRLAHEPTRLWRRYLVTNTIFIFAAIRQLYFKSK
jgi:N-acetylglucosaminyldiphosphoundecaprenol N-acetyl-beta-D-mannosaminyltransferase